MPLIVGRRHPVIEIELILAEPGVAEGEAISESTVSGQILVVLHNPSTESDTDGSMVSNYLIAANAISDSGVSGDLLRTFELGESISDGDVAGRGFISIGQISYSEDGAGFVPVLFLEQDAVSDGVASGDLLRAYTLGESVSVSSNVGATYLYISGVAYSDDSADFTPVLFLEQEALSDITTLGDLLRTYHLGETISDSDSQFDWFATWDLGEAVSEMSNNFSWLFEYAGEAVSDTYSSWIISVGLGNAVSETDGNYSFIGKSIHDLIELDDIINREIETSMDIVRTVNLEVYLIRK